jgi:hypothetical protein
MRVHKDKQCTTSIAKTTNTIVSAIIPPINPWLNISWADTVALCDKRIITPAYCSTKGIDIECLPELFLATLAVLMCLTALKQAVKITPKM